MPPSFEVLAIQVEQIRSQVWAMKNHARELFAADTFARETSVGECYAIDLLLGSVGATFSNAHKRAVEKALTDTDRKQAEEAAGRA